MSLNYFSTAPFSPNSVFRSHGLALSLPALSIIEVSNHFRIPQLYPFSAPLFNNHFSSIGKTTCYALSNTIALP